MKEKKFLSVEKILMIILGGYFIIANLIIINKGYGIKVLTIITLFIGLLYLALGFFYFIKEGKE